jgi:DNA-binding NarL/FixJ family response regulator
MRMKKVSVLVADDHELIRQGIRAVLHTEPNITVVGEAATGKQAVEQTVKFRPDVVIMDLAMPELDGLEATRRIRAARPGTRVIALTMHESEVMVRNVLNAGASGYVLKSELSNKLKTAVRMVSKGDRYLSQQVSEGLLNGYLRQAAPEKDISAVCLTDRERDVARLLSFGKSSKEIGEVLSITVRTVETHRANIMRKLNVHSVTELLHYVHTNGLGEVSRELNAGPVSTTLAESSNESCK